jgi:UDP-N-acetyl-D-glucosamine dehydrogenase
MPQATLDKIADALNVQKKALNGARILVAGIAYKRDIDDMRESPALDVMALLHQKGAQLCYADPHVPTLAARAWHGGFDLEAVPINASTLAGIDCVAILTDHSAFDYDAIVAAAPLVVDTRNAITQPHPHVFKLGAPQLMRAEPWRPAASDQAA